ncbi:MAG: translocation/assembly module TamB domain-containing protein [Pseudomonadota bacterium]
MARILIIVAAVLVGALALLLAATGVLFQTEAGRGFIARQAENAIGASLGGEAAIGRIETGLPGRVVIRDVRLSGPDGAWLTIDTIGARWSPGALVGGRIVVSEAYAEGARLLSLPPAAPAPEPGTPQRVSAPSLALPTDLPNVRVDKIRLTTIVIDPAVLGREATLSGAGRLTMGGDTIDAAFNAESADGRDRLEARVAVAGDDRDAALQLTSAADGVVAQLAQLGGPLTLTASTEEDALVIDGDAGAVATAAARLSADGPGRYVVRAQTEFGDKLAALIEQIGPRAALEATVTTRADGGDLTVDSIASDAGTIAGTASWAAQRDSALQEADAEFIFTFGDNAPASVRGLRDLLGAALDVRASLKPADRRAGTYALSLEARSEAAIAGLRDGVTDLQSSVSGLLSLAVAPDADLPAPLQDGVSVGARLAADAQTAISLTDVVADAGGARLLTGQARYDVVGAMMSADFTARVPAVLVKAIAGDAVQSVDGPLTAQLAVEGALDNFTVKGTGTAPAIEARQGGVPASRFSVDFAGLPARPAGALTGRPVDPTAEGRLSAKLASPSPDALVLEELIYSGAGFALTASGAADLAAGGGAIDAAYRGEPGAAPWPGLVVAGEAVAKGAFDPAGAGADMTISAPALSFGESAIRGLTVTAKGPTDAIAVALSADRIAPGPDAEAVTALSAAASADLTEGVIVALSSFAARYGETPLRTTAPARLTIGDAMRIEALRLAIGDGALAADVTSSADRLVATIRADALPALVAPAIVTLDADVDTARPRAGFGTFRLRPDATTDVDTALAGSFDWDGARIALTSAADGLPAQFDLAAPLAFTPGAGVAVDETAPIEGALRYDGPVEPLVLFAPAELAGLEGDLAVDAAIGGTVAEPEIDGEATFADGSFTELNTGFALIGLNAKAETRVAGGDARVTFSGGARGPGQETQTIDFEGDARAGDETAVDATLTLRDAVFTADLLKSLRASGAVTLTGTAEALAAAGEIVIDRMEVELAPPPVAGFTPVTVVGLDEIAGTAAAQADAGPTALNEPAPPAPLDFNIAIKGDDQLFVRGLGLDSEWRADLTATTARGTPLAVGTIDLRRGAFDFSGRRFVITQGTMTFDRLSANNPILDIRAEYETPDDVTAALVVTGRAQSPSVGLESTPTLPREDIMALVLFGKPASELSALESVQMAQALASLAGVGPLGGPGGGLAGSARDAVGLDMLNVDFDPATGGSALTAGKYVADGLFVSATQDVKGENGAVRIEYELTGDFTVETALRQNGDQQVSANWKKDF